MTYDDGIPDLGFERAERHGGDKSDNGILTSLLDKWIHI
jgi:hypothetical protein